MTIGLPIIAFAIIWFLVVEAHWFAERQKQGLLRGFGSAALVFAEWSGIVFLVFLVAR